MIGGCPRPQPRGDDLGVCHVDALSISPFSAGHSAGDPGRRGRHDGPESQLMSTQVSTTGPLGQPRGIGFAILIAIVTLGIYTLYWVFKTQEEVKEHSGIGVGGVLGLVIYILISPVTWFLIPSDVGKMFKADGREAPSRAGQASGCCSRSSGPSSGSSGPGCAEPVLGEQVGLGRGCRARGELEISRRISGPRDGARRRNLTAAERAAFELPFIPLADARALVELYAEKGIGSTSGRRSSTSADTWTRRARPSPTWPRSLPCLLSASSDARAVEIFRLAIPAIGGNATNGRWR